MYARGECHCTMGDSTCFTAHVHGDRDIHYSADTGGGQTDRGNRMHRETGVGDEVLV